MASGTAPRNTCSGKLPGAFTDPRPEMFVDAAADPGGPSPLSIFSNVRRDRHASGERRSMRWV